MGNSFFRVPNRKAIDLLKSDQKELDVSINQLRSDLKVKVNRLREKEGKEELKGFNLQALSREEVSAIHQVRVVFLYLFLPQKYQMMSRFS